MKPQTSQNQTVLWVVMLAIVLVLAGGTLYLVTRANVAPALPSSDAPSAKGEASGSSPGHRELPPGVTGTKDEPGQEPSLDDTQAKRLKGIDE